MESVDYKSTKLNRQQLIEMVMLYEEGNYSQEELAKKFEISTVTTNKILQKVGARRGVANVEFLQKIKQRLDEENNKEMEQIKKEVMSAKKESQLWPRLIGISTMQAVNDLKNAKNDSEVSKIQKRITMLKDASTCLGNVMNQRWKALGIDTIVEQESLPTLVIEDLTDEKLKEIHKKTRYQQEESVKELEEELDLSDLEEGL